MALVGRKEREGKGKGGGSRGGMGREEMKQKFQVSVTKLSTANRRKMPGATFCHAGQRSIMAPLETWEE